MHPQHYSSVKFRRVKIVLNTLATEASSCFVLINGIFDEAQMYGTTNVHLIWVNSRKRTVWIFENSLTFFQNLYQTNQVFTWINRSTSVCSKLLNCWCVETKLSHNIFQQLRTINVQTAVLCKFRFCIPNTNWVWNSGAWK